MKQFLKFVLATMVGLILLTGIMMLVIAGMVNQIGKGEKVAIEDKSILYLSLDQDLPDRTSDDPFERFAALANEQDAPLGLYDLIRSIDRAQNDERIRGIFLDLTLVNAGYAKTLELRQALGRFSASGKFVMSYSENYTNKTYYLASVGDKVFMNPKGNFLFNGMLSQVAFISDMLEKVGVEMQVIKRGKFKGAVEPFVLDGLSEENRLQIDAYLQSLFTEMISGIAVSRGLEPDSIRAMADRFSVRDARQAVEAKLIDGSLYKDQVLEELRKQVGQENDEDLNFVKVGTYFADLQHEEKSKTGRGKGEVALLFAEGSIVSGNGEQGAIGSEKFAKALRELRKDDGVKAVVIRVNSPGGSALASEVILREVELLKKTRPVIVSMGDVAASGGYYISCLADSILAQPNTLTGSIGVFGLIPNAAGLMNKIGVKMDYVGTGAMSEFIRMDRDLSPAERAILDEYVGNVYTDFIGHVSKGRGMTEAMVDSIGQGRVWTGRMAEALGLVDGVGGMQDAVRIAAEKAGLENYEVGCYPKSENPFGRFFQMFSSSSLRNYLLSGELGPLYSQFKEFKQYGKMEGVQAILPYQIEIR